MATKSMRSVFGPPVIEAALPSFDKPVTQLVSASQIYSSACAELMRKMYGRVILDRKAWEYAFVVNAIRTYCPNDGDSPAGVSFGCGREPPINLLAADGYRIVATDYEGNQAGHEWTARAKEELFDEGLVSKDDFGRNVSFEIVDMNNIPATLIGYDFVYSIGSLEHIGGHENGLDFLKKSLDCLKPGGLSVHTTEFVISSETDFFDSPELSFYCRQDFLGLGKWLLDNGHDTILNFNRGSTVADMHVDVPPFHHGRTLCAHFDTHVITSAGIVIQKCF